MRWNVLVEVRRRARSQPWFAPSLRALAAALTMLAGTAHAGLGDVQPRAAMSKRTGDAVSTTTSMPSYDRTETVDADGGSVQEFSTHDGTVFAIGFSGPTMPDLKAVLGAHYDDYVAAARSRRGNHHVVSVTTDDAVITIVKLPRGFAGHAHLPAAMPAGLDAETLR